MMTESDLEYKVAVAIMRAFFDRPVEEQILNVTIKDNLDLARAAIQCVAENDPCRQEG